MKKMFLTSSVKFVAENIANKIGKGLRTAFVTTASETEGPNLDWLVTSRAAMGDAGFDLFDYTVTGKTYEQIEGDLKDIDVLHVHGGNSFYLLLQSRKSGFDKFAKKFIDNGGIYIGSSAGSVVAAPDIEIIRRIELDNLVEELKTFNAFNLVDFIILPHWGSEKFRNVYLDERIENSYVEGNKIILLTDTQYVLVEGDMYRIVDVEDKKK
ncbi:hypothetical protein CMI42_05335 [Candidatus Pacearchaeota archaeon]|nr:hypothetical protein [Candidatus Pacearchaeota archaeon]|tara:strand:- start:448 stop:1080 length:633 start_codon:yes stop_codon:yes gene_type:complete